MKRLLTERLEKWKKHPRRKPLLLLGARQVGKTWLMLDFGKNHYKQVAYVRFASVHKHFSDIETFMQALKELRPER